MSPELSTVNEATLTVRRAELLGPVLGRVVGMLAARAQCPIDRLDDALLLTDAVAAHAPSHTADGHVTVHVHAEPAGLSLRIGPLPAEGADRARGRRVAARRRQRVRARGHEHLAPRAPSSCSGSRSAMSAPPAPDSSH